MKRFYSAPTRLLAAVAALSLTLGASACGNNSSKDEPTPTTKVNGKTVEIQDDGAVEIDGIFYKKGQAWWEEEPNGPSSIASSKTTVWCQGPDLIQQLIVEGYREGGGSSQRVTDHRVCEDGKISPGELTELPATPENQGN